MGTVPVTSTSGSGNDNAETLREKGNAEFRLGRFMKAIDYYTKAIHCCNENTSNDTPWWSYIFFWRQSKTFSLLSRLHGNRAECYLRSNMPTQALTDSLESAKQDRRNFKAHIRVGKSRKELGETVQAIESFVTAFNVLSSNCTQATKQEILSEIVKCKCMPNQIAVPQLYTVGGEMWAEMVLFHVSASDWNSAYKDYLLMLNTPMMVSQVDLDLKPLCNTRFLCENHWAGDFILFLLKMGSKHHTMTTRADDTYLHAGLEVAFASQNMGVFEWLFENKALPRHETHMKDGDGNSILHTACMCFAPQLMKIKVLTYLTQNCVDPHATNHMGRKAIQCIQPSDEFITVYFFLAIHYVLAHFTITSNKEGMGADRICESMYEEGWASICRQDTAKCVDTFVGILNQYHTTACHHTVVEKCLSSIVNTASPSDLDNISIKRVHVSIVKALIERLASRGMWKHMKTVVDVYGDEGLDSGLPNSISIPNLLDCDTINDIEKESVLRIANRYGAKFPAKYFKQVMLKAALNKSVGLMEYLFEIGGSPFYLSDDTNSDEPQLHAVFNASSTKALLRGLAFLKKLIALHRSNPKTYHYLHPGRADARGDTLLHLACKRKYSKAALELVQLLIQEGVQVDTKNKAGRTPVDCIVKHNDRRVVLLIQAGYTTPKTGSINSQKEKEESKEKLSEHQNKSSFTTEELAEKRSSQESTEKDSNQQQHSSPGKDTSQIQNVRMLVERLCANNKGSQHQRTIKQIVDTANVEDLPGSLMTIPLPQLKNLIQNLASKGKWHHVLRTIEILGVENLSPTLFQSISIRNFIASDSFQGQEDQKLKLYTIFCDHGANLSPKKGAESMHFAVKYKEVQLALRLVEDGVNTSAVTTDSGGNTPIHTALILALEKGNFGLLEKLMQLYKDDSKRHSDLNPNKGNQDQDTPLHVACKYPFGENAYNAVKLLCHWKVCSSAVNSEGKTPVQYVRDDKRFQLLNGYRLTPHKGMKEETRIQTKAPKKRPASETILEEHIESCKARIREKLCRMAKQKLSDIIKLDDKSGVGASEKSSYQSDVLDFDNLIWEIECLPSFWKELRKMTCVVKSQVIKALNQIGKGEWTRNVHKPVTHNGLQIPLYEAKTSKAARIIWEVGISRDISNQQSNTMYHEVIRVWAVVLDHGNLQRTIAHVVECHKRSESREKIEKMLKGCKHSQFEGCMKQRKPVSYVAARTNHEDDLDFCLVSDDAKMPHIHKFQTFSSAMVYVILQNVHVNVDFLFKVTDKERSIIDMKSKGPVLLLGRSGTGKTTCCVYRLWTHFATYWEKIREIGQPNLPMQDEDFESNCKNITDPDTHIHQLFLTKNNVLCTEVHKHFMELCRGQMATRRHAHKASEDLPPRLQDIDDLSYPLFLTSKQYLLMLDASLGPSYFFQREPDGTLSVRIDGWDDGTTLFGFSPLDIDPKDDDPNIEKGVPRNTQTKPMDPRKEVTYEVFAREIWPDIVTKVARKYHPSLVWAEIMSFIKGSFEALSNKSGHLTRDEYIDVGRKKAPFFVGKREIIYELFEKYSRFIKQRGLFDIVDVIQNIYKRLLDQWPSRPFIVHQIYVDETQDFTEAELFLLLSIMRNPNGMFLTGDTAQGITKGVSFRFCDLKSLFHHAKVSGLFETQYTITVPCVQKLTHNYRSHNGVLSLTSAILDVMEEFFPESFDKVHMERDVGLFQGPAPVLIQSCRREDLHTLLQGRNRSSSSPIDFGAHQAILVVNKEAKECVPKEMSRRCNVLTIIESKGLEFNDILLFNFFKDSQASKEWRVVASCLERHAKTFTEDHEGFQSSGVHPLAFEPNKHKILNFELKYLYTALTRARVNVWIFDEDEEKRAPMFQFFKAKNLVRCKSGQYQVPDDCTDVSTDSEADVGFAEESTPEDWVSQGDTFMVRRLYDDAAKCYRIAGDIQKEKSSMAHSRAMKAVGLKDNPRAMKNDYITAAEEFIDCDLGPEVDKKAALCLQYAKEYELAGMAYEKCEEFKHASAMYHRAEEFDAEHRCLEKAELAARNET
ncbi:TPR and ankyrin repeat-containing protein 1-like [Haliotis rufescens]|uniref:TPR and ankyrin repeat-containing protein 1-like n=1 Tax=Haliotis rufescens TaxID=6454 RepID=UPI001EB0915B|nr:TPR and ankyrin repeat-containing protein 1-like [Haliotis rufescens]XP_048257698.1 TPR and ankyrin repeat-containing protein 1-like [Haliotis rufescens]